jgi:DNA-binding transcriptional LysR family regulator
LPHAERLLELLQGTTSVVRQIHALERGSVLVGASTSAGAYVVPQLLGDFHRAYPRIHLSLRVANRLTMEEYLLTQQVDLAVMGLIAHPTHFNIDFLMRNDLIVVAASGHHLAGRTRIPLRDLQWETFLMREPGSGTRTDIERVFAQAGIDLHTRMELGDTGAIKEVVRAGLGIAVVFRQSVSREIAAGELIELNVEAFPLERRWYIAYLRGRRISRAAAALREHLLSHAVS